MVNSGLTINHDLDSGEIIGKFARTEFIIPKSEDLNLGTDLEDLAVSLLSEAISEYIRNFVALSTLGDQHPAGRLQQGFKAVNQLAVWLELHRGPDPTICAECSQQV